jgi:hypothetical protein
MHISLRKRIHALVLAVFGAAVFAGSPHAAAPSAVSVSPWKTNAAPMAWAGGRVYYIAKGANGRYDGWSANPDGSGAACLTCIAAFPATTQHGVSDVTRDGRYALVTIERSGHWPLPDGTGLAEPGRGAYNDLYLESTDGNQAWKLVNLVQQGTSALIWARFDASGSRVVWAEQWALFSSSAFGSWRLRVGTLSWTNGVPSLTNVKTLQSSGFLEPYGFSADGSKILFAADALAGSDSTNLQIMQVSSDLSGTATRLSPQDGPCTCAWGNYNEFAYVMPGSGRVIVARSVGAWYGSLEYWTMNPDGTDARQLTHLSGPAQSVGQIAGSVAFDPANPNRFVAAVQQGYGGGFNAVMVTVS